MTDQRNPERGPDDGGQPTSSTPWTPPIDDSEPVTNFDPARDDSSPEPSTSTFEPAEGGGLTPSRVVVARESGTSGAGADASRRASGVRWAVALGGVAIIIGVTAAIMVLASGRPSPSIAVGYMPANTVMYQEYRLDLPGDQRAKLAGFLSAFPGFDDQTSIETKLNEALDKFVRAVSQDEQAYTTDIEPWFGGQIAMGSGPPTADDEGLGSMMMSPFGGSSLFVISVKDATKAAAWIRKLDEQTSLEESQYNGATLFSTEKSDFSPSFTLAINDEVAIAGLDADVRAAIDSKGDGKLADDAEFKAAFGTVSRDYVLFTYVEYRSMLQSTLSMLGGGGGLDETQVDEEVIKLIPAWFGYVGRFEDDAFTAEATLPSVDFGFAAKNKRSTLAGYAPPGTLIYAESHDIGPAVKALIDRFRGIPDLADEFRMFDETVKTVGSVDDLIGWWGDVAFVLGTGQDGLYGGGLLVAPNDVEAAKRSIASLRSLIVFGGGQVGVEVRDVQHGDVTVSVIDFSEAAGSSMNLPPGYKPEVAYAITNDVLVIGYGEAFVNAVLDAGPGPSLADDGRFKALVSRIGDENLGVSYVDIRGIRAVLEPLMQAEVPADQWSEYVENIQPFLAPLDAYITGIRIDGALNRLPQTITVTKQ